MSQIELEEFPKLPEGYRWRVRYKPSSFMVDLDEVKVSIKRGWLTVVSENTFPSIHNHSLRDAALWAAQRAWSEWKSPSLHDQAAAIQAELNSGVLTP
ncbi:MULTISPECIES: hypothetical protein [Mycobacteroides]|uniref:hypothetical protein n=1 Tax=Mycobacteroides TaxID=670516 RepID=UPI0010562630|nr:MULTISPECIES: hypothetical protein [Mycobacteroides]